MAFPTAGTVSHHANFITPLLKSPNMPAFSPFLILHAEQKYTMIKDTVALGVDYEHECKIIDVIDKGKNAFIWYEVNSYI